jgi:hypothetical protein
MTRSTGVTRTAVRYARWGLPWICALLLSATLAYALDTAVAGGSWARQTQVNIAAQQTTDGPLVPEGHDTSLVALTQLKGSDSPDGCDLSGGRLFYVGLNTWIPAEAKVAPCPNGDR